MPGDQLRFGFGFFAGLKVYIVCYLLSRVELICLPLVPDFCLFVKDDRFANTFISTIFPKQFSADNETCNPAIIIVPLFYSPPFALNNSIYKYCQDGFFLDKNLSLMHFENIAFFLQAPHPISFAYFKM